jgi:integrase
MNIPTGSIFKLTIRYVYLRNNTYYYQRKIPTDLLERYGGTKLIKTNLKTLDIREVLSKVQALNKHYESTWETMRNNASITPSSVRHSAIALLKQYGLNPLPAINNEDYIDHFMDLVVEPKREAHANGNEDTYRGSSPEQYLTPVETESFRLLRTAPKLLLSEALDIYLNGHQKKSNETFRVYTQRSWRKLIEILGDIPFEEVSKKHSNLFVDKTLESGVKTTTVKRLLSVIKAVFNVVIIENEFTKTNPFLKPRIAGLGEDSIERQPFNQSELETLAKTCIKLDDDMRWLLALQMDLGSRLGEVVGLELEDFNLDAQIPYVSIKPHGWRTLKTVNSKRDIPLIGMSLWAAKQIKANASKDQIYAFPRYTNGKTCRATAASNALNSWIKTQGIQSTTHGFRHSMRDRLRNVNAPKPIQDAVGGWGKQDIGDSYGLGYGLETLKGWLEKVVLVNPNSLSES